jgi:hypothetical protein
MRSIKPLLPWLLPLVLVAASGQAPGRPKPPPFLASLQANQFVRLEDTPGGYVIESFENVPGVLAHTITEIAADHIVVENVAGTTVTRIPFHAIKGIAVTRAGKANVKPAERE